MDNSRVHGLYMQYLNNMDYFGTMKISGILCEKGHPHALYVEAESLFLTGKYEKLISLVRDQRDKKTIDINELYVASLALMGRFQNVRQEYKNNKQHPIGRYCKYYVDSLMKKAGQVNPYKIDIIYYEESFFRRWYLAYVVSELMAIYEMQSDLTVVNDVTQDTDIVESGYEDIIRRMDAVYFEDDNSFDDIKNSVYIRKTINPKMIYSFFTTYHTLEQSRDIITLVDLERRLKLLPELDETLCSSENTLLESIRQENKTAAEYIVEVCLSYNKVDSGLNNEAIAVLNKCEKEVYTYFPEMKGYVESVTNNQVVFHCLCDKSKLLLKAAVWQYNVVCSDDNYGFRDAGMLCLSYIRLLELEMNERVLSVLWDHREEIKSVYNDNKTKEKERGAGAGAFEEKWGNTKKVWKPDKNNEDKPAGMTAGEWGHFFIMFPQNKEDEGTKQTFNTLCTILKENVFNNSGMQALINGRLATFFDQDEVIEKYRNPPAHTRYVMISIANECKSFVETVVKELSTYYKEG